MAQPKRKTSKMKKRQRKAPSRYAGIQVSNCTNCESPILPHHACPACGFYAGKAVVEVEAAAE
ncbi:MAG: 50S ribosomal protein L32 [Lentisphaeraceae bacterium]|nr:50S ribosomal protein L32 [Lentisphaeraceae bacterium]